MQASQKSETKYATNPLPPTQLQKQYTPEQVKNMDLIALQIKTGGGAVIDERLADANR